MTRQLPIVGDWFAIDLADEHGIRRIVEAHVHDDFGGCMWLIEGSDRCLLVETGLGIAPLREFRAPGRRCRIPPARAQSQRIRACATS